MEVAKDMPLAEITLRRYEKPYEMPRRELIKKLCLSIGLLQPGDSRDIIVDILMVLLDAKESKKEMDSDEVLQAVIAARKKEKLPLKGIAPSNIRRQLKRLKDIFLAEKINNAYRISEFESLETIFSDKIEKFLLESTLTRVREYFKAVK